MKPLIDHIILIKGAGEKASAVAHHLYRYGFRKILMTDRDFPLSERREVCFSEALIDGYKTVAGITARKAENTQDAVQQVWAAEEIAVIADPVLAILKTVTPDCFIDAVMAKMNTGTSKDSAPLVIALGPGFTAGEDAHVVVETNPNSHRLGHLITSGRAEENTGIPTPAARLTTERIIRATGKGILRSLRNIGDPVEKGEVIACAGDTPVRANITGLIWGLVRDGVEVYAGQKIGDIDPRGERNHCFEIAPQANTIARAVLEAIILFHA